MQSTTNPAQSSSWDRLVAILPAACAIHCILTPFVAVAVPVVAFGPAGEWVAFTISAVLAVWAVRTTARVHGLAVVWLPVAMGLVLWATSLLGLASIRGEPEWAAGLGGLILAAGVVWSSRLRHRRVCSSGRCMV